MMKWYDQAQQWWILVDYKIPKMYQRKLLPGNLSIINCKCSGLKLRYITDQDCMLEFDWFSLATSNKLISGTFLTDSISKIGENDTSLDVICDENHWYKFVRCTSLFEDIKPTGKVSVSSENELKKLSVL